MEDYIQLTRNVNDGGFSSSKPSSAVILTGIKEWNKKQTDVIISTFPRHFVHIYSSTRLFLSISSHGSRFACEKRRAIYV